MMVAEGEIAYAVRRWRRDEAEVFTHCGKAAMARMKTPVTSQHGFLKRTLP